MYIVRFSDASDCCVLANCFFRTTQEAVSWVQRQPDPGEFIYANVLEMSYPQDAGAMFIDTPRIVEALLYEGGAWNQRF